MSSSEAMTSPSSPAARPLRPVSVGRPRRGRRALLFWGLVVLLVSASTVAVARYRSSHAKAPVRYETSAVDRGPIVAKVTATGTVSALVTVLVGSQVSGRIDTLGADFGSTVKKGQTIATIEPSFFRAAVAQARANLASARASIDKARAHRVQAERQFARAKALVAQGVGQRADLDTAEADLEVAVAEGEAAEAAVSQARAALAQAELNLKYTTIVSPIDGVVISRSVDVGQTVAATLQAPTLFTIAQDLTRMQVDTNVAEADVGKIRPGMPVTFTVDAHPQRTFSGTVRQVRDNAQTIQNVVTYDAVIDVSNEERLLKPGMTASVSFNYATAQDALRLPNAALRFKPDAQAAAAMGVKASAPADLRPDERLVYALRGGQAVPVKVKLGLSDGTSTEVLGGDLHVGDRAVVEAIAEAGGAKGR